jgi:hypothetical protein
MSAYIAHHSPKFCTMSNEQKIIDSANITQMEVALAKAEAKKPKAEKPKANKPSSNPFDVKHEELEKELKALEHRLRSEKLEVMKGALQSAIDKTKAAIAANAAERKLSEDKIATASALNVKAIIAYLRTHGSMYVTLETIEVDNEGKPLAKSIQRPVIGTITKVPKPASDGRATNGDQSNRAGKETTVTLNDGRVITMNSSSQFFKQGIVPAYAGKHPSFNASAELEKYARNKVIKSVSFSS